MKKSDIPKELDQTTTATTPEAPPGRIFAPSLDAHYRLKQSDVSGAFPYLMLLLDILVIGALFAVSIAVYYDVGLFQGFSRRVFLVLLGSNIVGLYLIGGYSLRTPMATARFMAEHLIVSLLIGVGVFVAIYAFVAYGGRMKAARSTVGFVLAVFPLCSFAYRYAIARWRDGHLAERVICVLGAGEPVRDLFRQLKRHGYKGRLRFFGDCGGQLGRVFPEEANSPLLWDLATLRIGQPVDGRTVGSYVVATDPNFLPKDVTQALLAYHFRGGSVLTAYQFLTEQLRLVPHEDVSPSWAFSEGFALNRSFWYERFKRLSDLSAATLGLLFLWPLILLGALLVRLSGSGPVIFRQTRLGRHEEPFTVYKLRTMVNGSEAEGRSTLVNDERITSIGKFLRKTRIDELPQLWNVLLGDMSLIGPRAEWDKLVETYEVTIPYYHYRHMVRPGITGWAQVNYPYGRDEKDALEKLKFDLYYVRHCSLLLDLTIVIKTIYMVVFAKGQ